MDEFDALQQRLPEVWLANQPGSTTEHVVIGLCSLSLGETLLAHYAPLLGALEHRFLLATLMMRHIPGAHSIVVTCQQPSEAELAQIAHLTDPQDPDAARRRLDVLVVPDDSPRGVSAKLLDRPDLLARLRRLLGDRPALIEPWNVTEDEVRVALALGVPLNGTAPELWPLAFKSAGRRLFAELGIPVVPGRDGVREASEVAEAICELRRSRPHLADVVLKQDNSGAGDGNWIVHTRDSHGHPVGRSELEATVFAETPAHFAEDFASGGVVEELVTGDELTSPSAQVDITPFRQVTVLSTHEQVLGGPNGQVFVGCRFPANPEYAGPLAEQALAVGERLADAGAVGRLAVDFVSVRNRGTWQTYALEVNLRKGGTTHPYSVLRHLAPGAYDPVAARWVTPAGAQRCYRSTDRLLHDDLRGLRPDDAMRAVGDGGLGFDHDRQSGVVLHMLSALAVEGRIGLTAVGTDRDHAEGLYQAAVDALFDAARAPARRRVGRRAG